MLCSGLVVDKIGLGVRLTANPAFQGINVILRVNSGQELEGVRAEHHVVGTDDVAVFVDPEGGRNVLDVVEVRQPVVGIDETRMVGIGFFDVGTRILEVAFERDRNQGEVFVLEFIVN